MRTHVRMHQDGMTKKFRVAVLSLILCTPCTVLLLTTPLRAAPITLYVGRGEVYTTIQAALDNASDGYRIFVYNGTYHEHLTINKRIDLFGEDRSITIINGSNLGTVVAITSTNVNLSHFTITHGGTNSTDSLVDIQASHCIITDNSLQYGYTGAYLNHSGTHLIYDNTIAHLQGDGIRLNDSNSNQNISYNTITLCRNGILSYYSDANRYYHNTLTANTHNGLFLNDSLTYNTIRYNNCSTNNHSGIYLNDFTNYTTILDNTMSTNHDTGLALENCSQATIATNIITKNANYGAKIIGSHNTLEQNTIAQNGKDGIYLSADDNNTIQNNTITANHNAGLRLYNSTADWITANIIADNVQFGAYLDFFTIQNLVYNNAFHGNTINAQDKSLGQNRWNITTIAGTNIIGGGNISGNYYDTYDQTSEGATDANGDGIADNPYTIYADNKDHGCLLDTIPPTIGTIQLSPTTQTLGGYTAITVQVTDNTQVNAVVLNVKGPSLKYTIPITHNKTGTTYTCNRQYLTVGNYTCNITATDPRNTRTTANRTFSIAPGTPPTLKDTSPKNASPSTFFTFTTNVTSTSASATDLLVNVVWIHASRQGNLSLSHATGNTFTGSILLDHSTHNLTYHFYARDKWGNALLTTTTTVRVIDKQKPRIIVTRYGQSYAELPGSYTFKAVITDDSTLHNATIEYWSLDQSHRKVLMDPNGTNTYEKIITPQETTDRIYCIINATDESGNYNNTKAPTAKPGGPYRALTNEELIFNASTSFDLDGNITTYHWSFGDGTIGTGAVAQHTYDAEGTYTLTLTVTDNEGRNGTNTTTVVVGSFSVHYIPLQRLAALNTQYHLDLTALFYCYDINGDGQIDSFFDPNSVLVAVHPTSVNLSGAICFLISTANDTIPEFLWNTTNDTILSITSTSGTILHTNVDETAQKATITIQVEKTGWVYLDTTDAYPIATLTVSTGTRNLSASLIWRENGRINILDDPSTEYNLTFTDIYPPLQVTFSPNDGGLINEYTPTISLSFNQPVVIIAATFGDESVKDDLVKIDEQHYYYTPPAYLSNGTYPLTVDAQALHGTGFLSAEAIYIFLSYGAAPQKSFLEKNGLMLLLGSLLGGVAILLLLLRWKGVTLDGSVYINTRRIAPFFKTVVVGPISVRIDDDRFQKAEFYVDGALKETATSFPYTWQWQEKAFFKHTLETKVFDSEGNSISSGPVDIYFFNPYNGRPKE